MTQSRLSFGERLPSLDAACVRLRWLTHGDAQALFDVFGDPEVARYWGFARLKELADATALVNDIHAQFHAGTLLQWGIEAAGNIVGTCSLAELDTMNRRAAIGFAVGRDHWRRGYAKAAVSAIVTFAFGELGLHRIVADADPRNHASIGLLECLGFRREGLLREHYFVADEVQDALLFGLLSSQWRACVR